MRALPRQPQIVGTKKEALLDERLAVGGNTLLMAASVQARCARGRTRVTVCRVCVRDFESLGRRVRRSAYTSTRYSCRPYEAVNENVLMVLYDVS